MHESKILMEEQKKLKEIDESLGISSQGGLPEKMEIGLPSFIGTIFPLKGKKAVVEKLKAAGWRCTYKMKRDNVFYQKMEKTIRYQKYALYKTSVGRAAVDYFDNIRDLKRNGIFYIGEQSLPVVVNRKGGYHTFVEEYERKDGFLEIIEIPEDYSPLSREEMYPKNSDLFKYGWIDRAGNTYACEFEEHSYAAEEICRELGLEDFRAEAQLEQMGYVKISRPVPYSPDNLDKGCPYFSLQASQVGEYISEKQYEKLCELGYGELWDVKFWRRNRSD